MTEGLASLGYRLRVRRILSVQEQEVSGLTKRATFLNRIKEQE